MSINIKSYDLTLTQQDILFDQLKRLDNPFCNIGGYITIDNVDVDKLKTAHAKLISSDDVFGIRIIQDQNGKVQQYIDDQRTLSLPLVDFSAHIDAQQAAKVWLDELFCCPFDLFENELFKAYLLKIDSTMHWYVQITHHIIMDGWGFSNLAARLSDNYHDPDCEQKKIHWSTVVESDQQYLDSQRYQSHKAFWQKELSGQHHSILSPHYLNHFSNNQLLPSNRSIIHLSTQQLEAIDDLANTSKVGVAQIYLALFYCYFKLSYTQQKIVFGVPFHNRKNRLQKKGLGVFTSISPMVLDSAHDTSFLQLLQNVLKKQKTHLRHQRFPFSHMIAEMMFDTRERTIYDIGFNYLKLDSQPSFEDDQSQVIYWSHRHEQTPLMINVWEYEKDQYAEIQLDFNLAYFNDFEVTLMSDRMIFLLNQVLSDPKKSINEYAIIPNKELKLLINDDFSLDTDGDLIHRVFEKQVQLTPDDIAVSYKNTQLDYKTLNAQANQLAHFIINSGIGPNDIVGVYLHRSVELLISILAVLKSGAAYLPLDNQYPQERIAYMLNDCATEMVLSESALSNKNSIDGVNFIDVRELLSKAIDPDRYDDPHVTDLQEKSRAYLIYTSGSTGVPKAVEISHFNAYHLIKWAIKSYDNKQLKRTLFSTSINFDLSVFEMFVPICSGNECVVVNNALDLIEQNISVTLINTVPSVIKVLMENNAIPESTQAINLAGEPLPLQLLNDLFAQKHYEKITNLYGPSEDTTYTTAKSFTQSVQHKPTIGQAIDNTQLYVVSETGQLQPWGIPGELCIAGAGVSNGYLNQTELTAKHFVQNSFNPSVETYVYKTGDMVRLLASGELDFLGRNDDQVKIRGHRVECGEIENRLRQCQGVNEAVVIAIAHLKNDSKLIGFVTLEHSDSIEMSCFIDDTLSSLSQKLPSYMVPSAIQILDELPLTANGKVDKKQLKSLRKFKQKDSAPLTTATQIALARLWSQVLGIEVDQIGANDDFFNLGGHSLLVVELLKEVNHHFGCQFDLKTLFNISRLSALSDEIDQFNGSHSLKAITKRTSSEKLPLSFSQKRIWLLDKIENNSTHYHIPAAIDIVGSFDVNCAEYALREIINRHEILRTVYHLDANNEPHQVVKTNFTFNITIHTDSECIHNIDDFIENRVNQPFDLANDLMLRVDWLQTASQNGFLLLNFHHIAFDGWSIRLFINEFLELYRAGINGIDNDLMPLPIQYADYALWQAQNDVDVSFANEIQYWTKQLCDVPPVHTLLMDHKRSFYKENYGASVRHRISGNALKGFNTIVEKHRLTQFELLHALFVVVLDKYSHSSDIIIGTPIANRMQKDIDDLIGCFVNTVVLRTPCDHNDTFLEHCKKIQKINHSAQMHQSVPFEYLVDQCGVTRTAQHSPLFQIMLSVDYDQHELLKLDGLQIENYPIESTRAKFDLELNCHISESLIEMNWIYNASLFKKTTIERFKSSFVQALQSIISDVSIAIKDMPLLPKEEYQHLIYDLNQQTPIAEHHESMIHQLFENQVLEKPNAAAVICKDVTLNYSELNRSANQLAHYLHAQGVTTGTFVGISMLRNSDMVIALLAIIKSGACYVALDPDYPTDRLKYIIEDAGIQFLLCHEEALPNDLDVPELNKLTINKTLLNDKLSRYSDENLSIPSVKENLLAYIIYTSGSTGRPKGVMIEHKNTLAMIHWAKNTYGEKRLKRVLASTSLNFDLSVFEIFVPLSSGGSVVLVDNILTLTTGQWDLSLINTVPSAIKALLIDNAIPENIECVNLAGEYLDQTLVNELYDAGVPEVFDLYGPSEDTTYSTYIKRQYNGEESIGRPIAQTQAYVLDEQLSCVPQGCIGELYLSGAGVARGYINQFDLTAQKFINNPFIKGHRMYKTGDLVKYLDDGRLYYVGRSDDQVKIRGFRIELGEIQQHLNKCEMVNSSVVMANDAMTQLVAYVLRNDNEVNNTLLINTIKSELQQSLPEYMLPAQFVVLTEWPLNNNGKIDRQALRNYQGQSDEKIVELNGPVEQGLAQIYATLLDVSVKKISAQSNFFEMGGDSLAVVKLSAMIRDQWSTEVSLREIFNAPNIANLAMIIGKNDSLIEQERIRRIDRENTTRPLSFAQQRLWIIDHMDGGSRQYNMTACFQVAGPFDLAAAQYALAAIIERHEPLRTVYQQQQNGEVEQRVVEKYEFILDYQDLSSLDSVEQSRHIAHYNEQNTQYDFNLSKDLMVRAQYLKTHLEHNEHTIQKGILLFCVHHIAADGWSISIMLKEFNELYSSYITQTTAHLLPLNISYSDYSHWQRQWLDGEKLQDQLTYWKKQLTDIPPVHSLPLSYPRPEKKHYQGRRISTSIPEDMYRSINDLANQHHITVFMLIHAALSLVFSRNSDTKDIIIGTPVANRLQSELNPLIGFFVNTLVLRVEVNNQSLSEYLRHIRTVHLAAQSNQDIPFEYLVEQCHISRSLQHTPVFQVLLSMEDHNIDHFEVSQTQFSRLEQDPFIVKTDLDISIRKKDGALHLSWVFDESLFDDSRVNSFAEQLNNTLDSFIKYPETPVCEMPLLSQQEYHHLLYELNDTAVTHDKSLLMHQLFEQQVIIQPDQTALSCQGQNMTYKQLNDQANQFCRYLQDQGVATGDFVGISMHRNIDMVVALLAVLKAGACYVALDPQYPSHRLQYMMDDAGIKHLVSHEGLLDRFSQHHGLSVINFDLIDCSEYDRNNPAPKIDANDLAYVIYTSGSTGQPKGVMIAHRNTTAMIHWAGEVFDQHELHRVLASTSLNFDLSVFELFVPLSHGGTAVIVENILDVVKSQINVSLINTVPSAIKALLDENAIPCSTKTINLAGEFLDQSIVERLYNCGINKVYDLYGPSEDTTYSTYVLRTVQGNASIGRPISNTQAYVLDSHLNCMPKGCIGELFLSGEGVTRGYLNKPELTREKYINHPFKPGQLLYRTGDLVRYLDDGRLAYVGRVDDQIKIRGFRVELGEVQQQINAVPAVKSNLVMAEIDKNLTQLVAYVVVSEKSPEQQTIATIKQQLERTLPQYMRPAAYVLLEQWPLTNNGKIDKQKLKNLPKQFTQKPHVEVVGTIEKQLLAIYSELLKNTVDQISADDDFFDLGGHSLLALRCIGQIQQQFNVEISIQQFFANATIRCLAQKIENAGIIMDQYSIVAELNKTVFITSAQQKRLWLLSQMNPKSEQAYHISQAMTLTGELNQALLQKAFCLLFERHPAFRTRFFIEDDEILQEVVQDVYPEISLYDASEYPSSEQTTVIKDLLKKISMTAFDLKIAPLVKLATIKQDKNKHVFFISMHHIIADGWSLSILIKELNTIYSQLCAGQKCELPDLTIQYGDYAQWQQPRLQADNPDHQHLLKFWSQRLQDLPLSHDLQTDYPRPQSQSFDGHIVNHDISPELSRDIVQYAKANHCTLFMLMQSVFSILLSRYSDSQDIVMGTPVANRHLQQIEPIIGCFINTIVLRSEIQMSDNFEDILKDNKKMILSSFAHQNLPFETLVDHMKPERNASLTPLFQVMIALHNNEQQNLCLNDLNIENYPMVDDTAKCDLTLNIFPSDDQISLQWQYCKALFKKESIQQISDHFVYLCEGLISNPQQEVGSIPMMTPSERQEIHAICDNNTVDHYKQYCVHELIKNQVAETPNKIAVIEEQNSLSYQQLNDRACQLAHYLINRGIGNGDVIAIMMKAGTNALLTMLAVMKTGAAYLPLDVLTGPQRLQNITDDAEVKFIITDGDIESAKQIHDCINLSKITWRDWSTHELNQGARSDDLMYILYTSGSTGQPKGVAIEHQNVSNFLLSMTKRPGFCTDDRLLAVTPITFDISVLELYLPLINGGTLVLGAHQAVQDGEQLGQLITDNDITIMQATPAVWRILMDAQWQGKKHFKALTGGEGIADDLAVTLAEKCAELWNMYGPTETTVWSSCGQLISNESADSKNSIVHIGNAIDNTGIFVLDDSGQIVPRGVAGHIHISGAGLARGYHNQDELTAQSFVNLQWNTGTPEGIDNGMQRMYSTGDLGKYNHDGHLIHLGRIDHQIKLNGFRIEPAEIEKVLNKHDFISEALVILNESSNNPAQQKRKELVAYYVQTKNSHITISDIRQHLAEYLPQYMIPAQFVALDAFPLNSSGKKDRKQLPQPQVNRQNLLTQFVAPSNDIEQFISETLADRLGVEKIGTADNFFELGANSLDMVHLAKKLSEKLEKKVSAVELFNHTTVTTLSEYLSADQSDLQAVPDRKKEISKAKQRLKKRMRRKASNE